MMQRVDGPQHIWWAAKREHDGKRGVGSASAARACDRDIERRGVHKFSRANAHTKLYFAHPVAVATTIATSHDAAIFKKLVARES